MVSAVADRCRMHQKQHWQDWKQSCNRWSRRWFSSSRWHSRRNHNCRYVGPCKAGNHASTNKACPSREQCVLQATWHALSHRHGTCAWLVITVLPPLQTCLLCVSLHRWRLPPLKPVCKSSTCNAICLHFTNLFWAPYLRAWKDSLAAALASTN